MSEMELMRKLHRRDEQIDVLSTAVILQGFAITALLVILALI